MQKKAVLALLVDGARADVMERMARAGELSAVDRHFVQRGGFATATSVFLTVSGPAHLPLLAGIHPGAANLPGIRWAERPQGKRGWFLGRTRSYIAPLRARKLERDVPASVKTLFAHVPKMADVNTWFVRGCPASARRTRWSKPTAFMRSLLTRDWHRSEDQAEKALLDALDRGFTSVHAVFPAIDELGHRFGPLSEPSFEAYRHFDRALERIVDGLARRKQLDETLIVISSDHGQTATHTHVDIDRIVADVYPKTVCYPKIWRHALSAQAAVMVSGNSCTCRWIVRSSTLLLSPAKTPITSVLSTTATYMPKLSPIPRRRQSARAEIPPNLRRRLPHLRHHGYRRRMVLGGYVRQPLFGL